MNGAWRQATVDLVAGYDVTGEDGLPVSTVPMAQVVIEGGFVKLDIAGTGMVQVVSAPAVRLITYPSSGE